MHRFVLASALIGAGLPLVSLRSARAGDDAPPPRQAITFYYGQAVDANLTNVIPDIVTGDLHWKHAWLAGAGYLRDFANPVPLQRVLDAVRLPNVRNGAEVAVVQHWGTGEVAELGAEYRLTTPAADLGCVDVRFGVGLGLSYVFGVSNYEDGTRDDPNRRYRLLNFNTYEFEWRIKSAPNLSLVTHIHHRSGIYGLIAPRHVGSNFMAVGVRVGF